MKAPCQRFWFCLAVSCTTLPWPSTLASAQSYPPLSLQVAGGFARLGITGDLGSTWAVEYNGSILQGDEWLRLTNLTITATPMLLTDPAPATHGSRFYRAFALSAPTNVVTTDMVWVPPGKFMMGSPDTEVGHGADETQHLVTLTQGFFIGIHLVTQGEYLSVISNNPSYFTGAQGGTDLSRPVETVYWYSAAAYCQQLTQLEQAAGRLPGNWAYRLPTEAEWEYSCRAGSTNRFSYGEDPTNNELQNYAWYSANSADLTHAVGQKLPNAWGLYDVHGNVFEWCQDWYGRYPSGPVTNPQGAETGTTRVFRGGAWLFSSQFCRSAGRYQTEPTTKLNYLGFRVVAAPAT